MITNLSVLISTYNCGKYLSASIKSILSQSFKNFELVIVDDGSSDNTQEILNSINDTRINYNFIEHKGRGSALNIGLDVCSYDWVALMDADDISHPQRFEKQIEFLNDNPNYNVISCWYALFTINKITHIFKLPINHFEISKGLKLHSTLCHAGTVISKRLVKEYGGYNNRSSNVDYDLWLRIKEHAVFYNIPEVLMLVRYRKDSLHRGLNMNEYEIVSMQRKHSNNFVSKSFLRDNKLEGWREWFYGNKKEARKFWYKYKRFILTDFRIILAIMLSFLPNKYFQSIKSMNIKARLQYIFLLSRKDKKSLNSIIIKNS